MFLILDASVWIQAGSAIVAALATLAAVWIAYKALSVSSEALGASNRGLALAEENIAAQFRVEFGARLLVYGVEGDARGGSAAEEHPAIIRFVLRNVGNELATRISVSACDAQGNILLWRNGEPVGEQRESLQGRASQAGENEWDVGFTLPKGAVYVGWNDPGMWFSPYGAGTVPEMHEPPLETATIFRSYDDEVADAVAMEGRFGPSEVGPETIAESSLHFSSGVSIVCTYSDALGRNSLTIPEPEWVADPEFTPWEEDADSGES